MDDIYRQPSLTPSKRDLQYVTKVDELSDLYQVAYQEALNGFGNGDLYIEKFIEEPRHIEIQILADKNGNVISESHIDQFLK